MAKIKKENKHFIFDRPITLNVKYYIKRIIYFFYAGLCHFVLSLKMKRNT